MRPRLHFPQNAGWLPSFPAPYNRTPQTPLTRPITHSITTAAKITVRKPPSSMARKADDLLADLENLGGEEKAAAASNNNKATPSAAGKSTAKPATARNEEEEDPLAEFEKLAAKPAQASSRPTTPRLSSSTTSGTNKSPKRAEHTPASSGPPSGRTSEDRLRKEGTRSSGEGQGRSYHLGTTVAEEEKEKVEETPAASGGGGGGWWGSVFSAATAAVKQAENIAKEIRSNEEAVKWAEQVRGYGAGLQSLSTFLTSY